MKVENWPITKPIPYSRNPRRNEGAIAKVAGSLKEFGWRQPIVVDTEGVIIAGHTRLLAAQKLGLSQVPVHIATDLSPQQIKAYRLADNRVAQEAEWDMDLLKLELSELDEEGFSLDLTGFNEDELEALLAEGTEDGLTDEDETPEVEEEAITLEGDLWILGKHRLRCGDSTQDKHVLHLLNGKSIDLVCTDPPYCSGGFQESGKSVGSVGTDAAHKMIANDTLSTRGYIALLKTSFAQLSPKFLYAFTDWRMWTYLFDIAESSGFGVRSMIVWDKGTPGMGRGWRAQHELILWGCKQTPPFEKTFGGHGNVLQAKRTGNKLHTTEKPVDLIESLIKNVPFVSAVADPFNGSGTTLIACEKLNKSYFGMELDTLYVDVAVKRWQQFTGKEAILESSGKTFAEVEAERKG
jgi:DNA modification methylase